MAHYRAMRSLFAETGTELFPRRRCDKDEVCTTAIRSRAGTGGPPHPNMLTITSCDNILVLDIMGQQRVVNATNR
jgi:hypothetical protein